jgi:lysophospholipase L1-like esterase
MAVPLLLSATKRLSRRALLPRNYATRVDVPNVAITGGLLGGTTHLRHTNRVAFRRCRVVLPLFYGLFNGTGIVDTDLSGTVQAACSLEYPFNSGTRYSFLFSGVRNPSTTAAAVQGYLLSDWLDLGFTVPANTAFGSFTFLALQSGNTPYGNVYTGGAGNHEGATLSATPQDLTVSGGVTDGFAFGVGPLLILTEGVLPSVAIWGDSIAYGTGGTGQGDGNGNTGWPAIYTHRHGAGYCKFAVPSERMTHANPTNWARRLPIFALSNATHVISTYGTNDLRVGLTTTLSAMQGVKQNELALYQQYRPGVRILGAPLLPRTSSTDSWVTTTNQTGQTNFTPLGAGVREQYNDWLRGRPAGFTGCLDITGAAETAVNSGLWRVNGSANYATNDGTHPSQTMHSAIANALPLGLII